MPKVKPLIPDAVVLEKFSVLDPNIQLIPPQVGMILGISVEQLDKNRSDGLPPSFVKQGGSIRYRVGDIRDYQSSKPVFTNTAESFVWERNQKKTI